MEYNNKNITCNSNRSRQSSLNRMSSMHIRHLPLVTYKSTLSYYELRNHYYRNTIGLLMTATDSVLYTNGRVLMSLNR